MLPEERFNALVDVLRASPGVSVPGERGNADSVRTR